LGFIFWRLILFNFARGILGVINDDNGDNACVVLVLFMVGFFGLFMGQPLE